MITAIDTNVLLDILIPNPEYFEASAAALEASANAGTIAISDIVYAELCVHFGAQHECDAFLESNDIRMQALTREAHFLASRAWRTYRLQGGKRTRILPVFSLEHTPKSWRHGCSLETVAFTTSSFRRSICTIRQQAPASIDNRPHRSGDPRHGSVPDVPRQTAIICTCSSQRRRSGITDD